MKRFVSFSLVVTLVNSVMIPNSAWILSVYLRTMGIGFCLPFASLKKLKKSVDVRGEFNHQYQVEKGYLAALQ